MPSPDDQPDPAEPVDDPTARADDGMAPLIANTGDDAAAGDDADAAGG